MLGAQQSLVEDDLALSVEVVHREDRERLIGLDVDQVEVAGGEHVWRTVGGSKLSALSLSTPQKAVKLRGREIAEDGRIAPE